MAASRAHVWYPAPSGRACPNAPAGQAPGLTPQPGEYVSRFQQPLRSVEADVNPRAGLVKPRGVFRLFCEAAWSRVKPRVKPVWSWCEAGMKPVWSRVKCWNILRLLGGGLRAPRGAGRWRAPFRKHRFNPTVVRPETAELPIYSRYRRGPAMEPSRMLPWLGDGRTGCEEHWMKRCTCPKSFPALPPPFALVCLTLQVVVRSARRPSPQFDERRRPSFAS